MNYKQLLKIRSIINLAFSMIMYVLNIILLILGYNFSNIFYIILFTSGLIIIIVFLTCAFPQKGFHFIYKISYLLIKNSLELDIKCEEDARKKYTKVEFFLFCFANIILMFMSLYLLIKNHKMLFA